MAFYTIKEMALDSDEYGALSIRRTDQDGAKFTYPLKECIDWIKKNGFKRVCLQIPNVNLGDATFIAETIEKEIHQKVYLLCDTAYESCCVDYAAARRINADAIIHFGQSCNSEYADNELPIKHVIPRKPFDVDLFIEKFAAFYNMYQHKHKRGFQLACSKKYSHITDILYKNEHKLREYDIIMINPEDIEGVAADLPVVYMGENDQEATNFQKYFEIEDMYICNPTDPNLEIKPFTPDSRADRRKNYLREKIKDAHTIGLVVATLAVKNYLEIADRLKAMCKAANKKCYIISVGKPNVAKLANFPEIDVFAVIACPANDIYENRDFYKPIVSPYDVEVALNANFAPTRNPYNQYDFNEIDLESEFAVDDTADVSLLTGNLRHNVTSPESDSSGGSFVVVRQDGTVATNEHSGAGYLANRSWQGLEQNLGGDEPELAGIGRRGLARGYENEEE